MGRSSIRFAYNKIFGTGAKLKPWHFQFLGIFHPRRWLSRVLPNLRGLGIDVGCGDQPYRYFMKNIDKILGLDIITGEKVDVVVKTNEPWPIQDCSNNFIFSSQVIELLEKPNLFFSESYRVLKKDSNLILVGPFIYNEVSQSDRLRFSLRGICELAEANGFTVIEAKVLGAIGSTIGMLFLNWFYTWLTAGFFNRYILRTLLLPILPFFNISINVLSLLLNTLDSSGRFYSSFGLILKK